MLYAGPATVLRKAAETARNRPLPDALRTERVTFRRTLGSTIMLVRLSAGLRQSFLTVLAIPEPVVFGQTFLPGLRLYDAVSVLGRLLITLLPFCWRAAIWRRLKAMWCF